MKKWTFIVKCIGALAAFGVVGYAVSIFWPVYLWGMRLPSPDGKYDLVVTLGDKAALDDFFYTIHVFPRAVTPADRKQGERIWRIGIWRDDDYVVYSGYSYPGYRWTGAGSLEIDIEPESNGSVSIWSFNPALKTGVLVSLVVGGKSVGNHHPTEPADKKEPESPDPRSPSRAGAP